GSSVVGRSLPEHQKRLSPSNSTLLGVALLVTFVTATNLFVGLHALQWTNPDWPTTNDERPTTNPND
ncbi:MAG: hypothetical protein WBQ08_22320, partial [Candidatus Sulfotelmatobacter sp.]